jgi:N-acetylneuraminic acid mutarotase
MHSLKHLGAIILAALFVWDTSITASAQPRPAWTTAAPMPDGGAGEMYGATVNDKLYTFGGLSGPFSPMGRVYEFDPAANHWTRKHDMPQAVHHTAQVGLNGKIYLFGGFAAVAGKAGYLPTNNAWEYTPATDTWRALASMPTARGAEAAVTVNGLIYVVGGAGMHPGVAPAPFGFTGAHQSLDAVEEYNPASNTWRVRSPLPTARNHFSALAAVDGKIYAIVGRVGSVYILDADSTDLVEVYDVATNSWGTVGARMPVARSGGCFGVYNGDIYAAGGEYRDGHLIGAFTEFDVYHPRTNTWNVLPEMPVPRHGCSAAFIGNTFYIAAGGIVSGGTIGGVPVATPEVDAFEVRGATP